jgi:PKD repeat protein
MKLCKIFLFYLFAFIASKGGLAQGIYSGGISSGYSRSAFGQATMNIFGGGSADGYSKLNKAQLDAVSTFFGGIADGYSAFNFSQATPASTFFGGIADGYSRFSYSQPDPASISLGGIADGYSKASFAQLNLGNMFFGGIADGYSKATYAQADPAVPNVNFLASDTTLCMGACISFTDQSSDGPTSWSWSFPGASITSSTLQNPTNICYNTPGNYTVTLRATNVIGTDSLVKTGYIVVNALPVANAGPDVSICSGSSTTLNASGGISYSWSPSAGLSSTTASNPVASPSSNTTYTVTVSSAECSSTDAVQVTVNSLPTVSASPITICAGASGTLTASGASVYSWAPSTGLSSATGTSVTASPTTTTTYTVTGTTVSGCSSTTTVTVTVTPAPPADAGSNVTICNGSSTTLNASGGTSYSWSPATGLSSPFIANPVASPTTTRTYTVTVTSGGCSATDVVTVAVTPLPAADAGANVSICNGSSTALNASGGTSYSWLPAAGLSSTTVSNPVASPTVTTTYTVTVTNSGCSATDVVTVTVNPVPLADAGTNVTICNGSSTSLSASGGGGYSWSPATGLSNAFIPNPVASPSTTTSYTVTVTNGGCSSTDAVTVTVNPAPLADAGSNVTICDGASATLNASGGISYNWIPAGSLSSSTISNPVASPASTTTYTVTVTDAIGCSATDAVTVSVNIVAADAGANTTVCTGFSTTLNASGGTSYSWTPAGTLSSATIANPVASPTATTTYTVTVTNAGCSATDVVTVTVNTTLTADAGSDTTICAGASIALNATGGSSYSWSPASGLSSASVSNPVATPAITTTYTVTVSSGGCSFTDAVTVTVESLPAANITPDGPTTFCQGDSVTLTSSAGNAYLWTGGATASSITVYASGTYAVTVTSANGCSATSAGTGVTVHAITASSINPGGPTTFCMGGNITLTASTGSSYVWSTGETTQSINVSVTDDYFVSVADINGCSTSSDTISITVNPNPAAPVISPAGIYNICVGDTVILNAPAADTYLWSNGATTASIPVSTAGFYSVIVYNSFGCGTASADSTEVTVNDPVSDFTATPLLVFIPSANVSYTAATNGSGPFTYLWDFGDASTSAAAAPNHTYGAIGFKTVTLTVSDSTGCSKSITKTDYIQVEQLFPSTALTTGTTVDISGLSFVNGATGIFTLTDGNCIITLDTGNTWSPLPTGNSRPLTGATLLSGNWFVTGDSGTILHSTNNGSSWTPQSTGTLERFNGSSFTTVSNGFAVGTNGTIQRYDGSNWLPEISGTSMNLNSVEALSSGDAIAVGDNQTILYYNGSSWTPQTSPLNFDIRDIKFSSNLSGYAVGAGGIIIKTIDGGNTWTPSLTGIDEDFNSVTVEGPDSAWATGTGGVVYTTVNDGATWIRYSVGHLGTQKGINKTPAGKGHVVGHGGHGRSFDRAGLISVGVAGAEKVINTFKVYPNPAHDQITISMELFERNDLTIVMRDVNGKELESIRNSTASGTFSTELNIERYTSGIYFIHAKSGEQSWVQKLIITK